MENKIIFETKGGRDRGSATVAAILIVPCLIMIPVSTLPKEPAGGPWYIWVAGLVACIAYIYFSAKRNKVVLQVKEGQGDEIILSLTGNGNTLDFSLNEYSNWFRVRRKSQKMGGTDLMQYFLGQDANGEKIYFATRADVNNAPKGWPQHQEEFPVDAATYTIDDLPGLVKCLEEHERRQRKIVES